MARMRRISIRPDVLGMAAKASLRYGPFTGSDPPDTFACST